MQKIPLFETSVPFEIKILPKFKCNLINLQTIEALNAKISEILTTLYKNIRTFNYTLYVMSQFVLINIFLLLR